MRLLVITWFAANLLQAQQPASFAGTVINSSTREPVRKARVFLRPKDAAKDVIYTADTDANGTFKFPNIVPGAYSVSASRLGFFAVPEGAPGAISKPALVDAGDNVKDFVIFLAPACVIAGKVLDQDGDPVRGATVQAVHYTYSGGKKQLHFVTNVMTGSKGEYRLFGLQSGTYYVRAIDNNRGMMAGGMGVGVSLEDHSPTYFPGVTDPGQATPSKLAPGSEFRDIDITLRKERTYSVSGTLSDVDPGKGGFIGNIVPSVGPEDGRVFGLEFTSNKIKWEFRANGLPNGSYILSIVRFAVADEKSAYAQVPVEVAGADLTGLTPNLQPGIDVGGTVRVEGTATPEMLTKLNLTLVSDPAFSFYQGSVHVDSDGKFVFQGVPPMIFSLELVHEQGIYLKSIKVGDQSLPGIRINVSEAKDPLTVLLGTDTGTVQGSVQHANGEPAARVRVTLVPYGANLGRMDLFRFAFTDDKGVYQAKDVAPGEYKLFAWEDVEIGAPQDPEYRKQFEKMGVPLILGSSGHATVALTAIVTKEQ